MIAISTHYPRLIPAVLRDLHSLTHHTPLQPATRTHSGEDKLPDHCQPREPGLKIAVVSHKQKRYVMCVCSVVQGLP